MKLELNESIVLVADNVPSKKKKHKLIYFFCFSLDVITHHSPTGLTIKFLKYCTIRYPVEVPLDFTTASPL